MASKKGVSGFTSNITKELISEQKKKEREIIKLEKINEKIAKQNHIEQKYKEAEKLTLERAEFLDKLNNIINNKQDNLISIEEFIKKDINKLQLPKELLIEQIPPTKPQIRKSNILEKLFKTHKLKYNTYINEIKNKYNTELNLYKEAESKRIQEINSLTKAHELQTNEYINTKKELYSNRDIDLITEYKTEVLNKSKYPFEFTKNINTGYCKDSKKLVIDYLLPKIDIVPQEESYEYKPRKNEIREKLLKEKDRKNIYNEVIFSIALKSIYEVFSHDKVNNIESIVFNGYIEDIDLSTGKDKKSCVISAMIDKNEFDNIDITKVDKLVCLKEKMNARISINSLNDLNDVIPIYKLDKLSKSVLQSEGINLLDVDPFDFEDLITNLFRKMGYDAKTTQKTNDGGIDCELYSSDPILGGKFIVQVKRYKNNIDIPKLREFESVLRNSDAMKGIFISTSSFSLQCEKFASENNIQLIDGNNLIKHLNNYGISSYILF